MEMCPACGEAIDYCQGHGEMGDPKGFTILALHDDDIHSMCHSSSACLGPSEFTFESGPFETGNGTYRMYP